MSLYLKGRNWPCPFDQRVQVVRACLVLEWPQMFCWLSLGYTCNAGVCTWAMCNVYVTAYFEWCYCSKPGLIWKCEWHTQTHTCISRGPRSSSLCKNLTVVWLQATNTNHTQYKSYTYLVLDTFCHAHCLDRQTRCEPEIPHWTVDHRIWKSATSHSSFQTVLTINRCDSTICG